MAAVWVNELGGVTFAVDGGRRVRQGVSRRPNGRTSWWPNASGCAWADALYPGGAGAGVRRRLAAHRAPAGALGRGSASGSPIRCTAARAIGEGLRRLHDALPVDECPFGKTVLGARARAPADRLVVCHGDACAPTRCIGDDGTCSGHVDLGDLGVADRWADLAVATLSLDWNFPTEGAGRARKLLDAYGVDSGRRPHRRTTELAWDASGDDQTRWRARLARAATPQRKVISAGHERRARRFPDRHNGGKHPVRPVGQPGVLRIVVPVPRQQRLDWDALGDVDYLYVSHLHRDHFDPKNLREHVNKDAVVLLPDFPVPDLQRELEKVGFHRFFETTDSVKHRVSGPKGDLDVMIIALRAPADGPIGDSGLVVDDGETVCFNMNDARPVDLDVLHADFGPVDVHMLQYSGAIWYPMVYDMPARAKEAFGTQKRQRQMDRCRQYIAQVGATWVVPSAGPPCFLDPELRDLNDDHGDPANIFPDQVVFLDQMRAHGHDRGLLMIPGSTADFTGHR